ncbi:uncharacterized protein LOC132194791 [Neocloeon triangulifer]|uniref:uncharacterized protein LOC132194791 n=1 Tax=Neocloeon triangulifer TaxID=2078957 RepID=UPI00286F2BB7|nr:uncharacterized protein LOC132194791 [Neocloeon triangulifer]
MWSSFLCCFKWLKFSNKAKRSGGVRHDPGKYGHYRGGPSQGAYKRRKVSRIAGTISMEDVRDEGISPSSSRSGINSPDRSRAASPVHGESGSRNHGTANTLLTVPMRGMGKKRFITPSLAASTPDLRTAQQEEMKHQFDEGNLKDNSWLSSQSITNLSSNYERNITSRSNSPVRGKKDIEVTTHKEKLYNTESSASASVSELPEADQDTRKARKRDFLTLPFQHLKSKLSSSTPNLAKNKQTVGSGSNFFVENEPERDPEESACVAKQHGLNLEMYLAEQQTSDASPSPSPTKKFSCITEDYSFGSIILTPGYQHGQLKVAIKKIQGLPFKGKKPLQYSVLIKVQVMPENKKIPIRYSGHNVVKMSPNPIMDEEFIWNGVAILDSSFLRISVYEKGRQERYDAIGHVLYPLIQSDLIKFKQVNSPLRRTSAPSQNRGLVQLSLAFSEENTIDLNVFQVSGLQLHDEKLLETSSFYLKAGMYVKGKKEKSEKSKKSPLEESGELFFDHKFRFPKLPENTLADSMLVLSVLHKNGRFGHEVVIGKVAIGPYFFLKDEQTDWGRVVLGKKTITSCYYLQTIE